MLEIHPNYSDASNAAIGAALEDLIEVRIADAGYNRLAFEVDNTHATVAFTDFALLGRAHEDASYHTIISGAGWATLGAVLLFINATAGVINTLAAGEQAMALLDVSPFESIKLQAKTGTTGAATIRVATTRA